MFIDVAEGRVALEPNRGAGRREPDDDDEPRREDNSPLLHRTPAFSRSESVSDTANTPPITTAPINARRRKLHRWILIGARGGARARNSFTVSRPCARIMLCN